MGNNPNKCISCGYTYKPVFGLYPNCGKTSGLVFLKQLKIEGCILVVFVLVGLLSMPLQALGLLPEQ